jgi:hypothetical protein
MNVILFYKTRGGDIKRTNHINKTQKGRGSKKVLSALNLMNKSCRFKREFSYFWRMPSSGIWSRVDLVWTLVSEECIASIFRVEKSASEEPSWACGCRLFTFLLWQGSLTTCRLHIISILLTLRSVFYKPIQPLETCHNPVYLHVLSMTYYIYYSVTC